MTRPMRMNRRIAMVMALLVAALSARVMAKPAVSRPVVQFIHFYEQSDDLGVWERVIYSLLLTRTTEPSS